MRLLKPPAITRADRCLLAVLGRRELGDLLSGLPPAAWWDILGRARRHSVHVMAAHRLFHDRALKEELPAEIRQDCHDTLRKATLLSMILREKLTGITDTLLKLDITPVLLKGASLGWTAYPDPSIRLSRDLDVLVTPDRIQDAYVALTSQGYRPNVGAKIRAHETRHHFHHALFRDHHVVELHWELVRPGSPYALPAEAVFRNAVPEPADPRVLHESHEDQVLHAAAQSLSEGFSNLVRICDMDRILAPGSEPIDWDSLVRRAREGRLGPAVDLLLEVGERLLGTPRPPESLELRVPRSVRVGVEPLQPATALMAGMRRRRMGFAHLLRFWLLPGARLQVLSHLVFGHPRDRKRPGRGRAGGTGPRVAGVVRRTGVLVLLAVYQVGAFLRRRVDRFEKVERTIPASSGSSEAAPPVRRESPGPDSP